MDHKERRVIDDLFVKVREAERQGGPRDAEAEALIRHHVSGQPAAPYYMAQAIVVQQDALANAQTRIQELEQQLAERPAGGFLASLFGGGQETAPTSSHASAHRGEARADYGRYRQQGTQGGFLGGAMQTAMGVAGGFLIANAISSLLAPDDAAAASSDEAVDPFADEGRPAAGEDFGSGADPGGGDFGGDF